MLNTIKKLILSLMLCGQFMQVGADDSSWFLDPMSVDFLYISDKADLTRKGNIYEKTFRMPLDLWRVWFENYIDICISVFKNDEILDGCRAAYDELETLPIKNIRDFLDRLYIIQSEYSTEFSGSPSQWMPERKEAIMRFLEAYHPNQYFRFKIVVIPSGKPKDKQEKILEFPLYFVGSRQKYQTCLRIKAKTWRRNFVMVEALENTTLPKGIVPYVTIISGSYK